MPSIRTKKELSEIIEQLRKQLRDLREQYREGAEEFLDLDNKNDALEVELEEMKVNRTELRIALVNAKRVIRYVADAATDHVVSQHRETNKESTIRSVRVVNQLRED